jgi:hypothetical protein
MILTAKSITKYSLITVLSVLFLVYIFSQGERYLKGPIIELTHPQDGISTTTQAIYISGKAQRIAFLSLNDMQIFATDTGYFREKLLLSPGYNIIEAKVTDRFERERIERLHITYLDTSEELVDLSSVSTTSPPLIEGDVTVSSTTEDVIIEDINNN